MKEAVLQQGTTVDGVALAQMLRAERARTPEIAPVVDKLIESAKLDEVVAIDREVIYNPTKAQLDGSKYYESWMPTEYCLNRMKRDFEFFISCISIKYRNGMTNSSLSRGPFIMNSAQRLVISAVLRMFASGKPTRVIVLKSRQLGMTTLSLAFYLWLMMKYSDFSMVFIIDKDAHNDSKRMEFIEWCDELNRLFGICKIVSRVGKTIRLANKSFIIFESAQAPNVGTSETISGLHESEKPKWPSKRATQVRNSVLPGLPDRPGTVHINESTADGLGMFHEQWRDASEGRSNDMAVFAPWFLSPEYSENDAKGFEFSKDSRFADFDPRSNDPISEETYAALHGLSNEQILWRRKRIIGFDGDRAAFDREYPTTPAHAFRASSFGFFPRVMIDLEPIKPVHVANLSYSGSDKWWNRMIPAILPQGDGPLKIYKFPEKGKRYYIGCDFTEGKQIDQKNGQKEPDYHVFTVRDDDYELAARWRSNKYSVNEVGPFLSCLGSFYNTAEINGERNGPGLVVLSKMIDIGYPKLWRPDTTIIGTQFDTSWMRTTGGNRDNILEFLKATLMKSRKHDKDFLEECAGFQRNEKGKVAALNGYFDDCIMSEAVCHAMWIEIAPKPKMQKEASVNAVREALVENDERKWTTSEVGFDDLKRGTAKQKRGWNEWYR